MKQPLMLQSDCNDCKLYEGFGQCYEHGNNMIENCKNFAPVDDCFYEPLEKIDGLGINH